MGWLCYGSLHGALDPEVLYGGCGLVKIEEIPVKFLTVHCMLK